jgi:hypothetical protein
MCPTTSRLRLALMLSTVFGLSMLVGCEDSITPFPAANEISISPASGSLELNAAQQAPATYSDSSKGNRTSPVTGVSSRPAVVSVGSAGPAKDLVSNANAPLGSAKSGVLSVTPPPVLAVAASRMWSWKITPATALTNVFRIDHREQGRAGARQPGHAFADADWNRPFPAISFNSALSSRLCWGLAYRDGRVAYNLNRWISLSASGRSITHGSQTPTGAPAVERRLQGTMSFNF